MTSSRKMAAMDWRILEDGSLSIGEKTRGISYHPKLNTLLVVTEDSSLQVLDVNTGVILQKSTLCADPGSSVECKYLNEVEQVLFKSNSVVGLRKDISGVLLLDSALQAPVSKTDDFVVVELTHSEAIQLLACLKKVVLPGQEYIEEVRDGLQMGIMSCTGAVDHSNHKVAKWATVKMNLPHTAIRSVCSSLVSAPQNTNKPGLSIASAILDRLDSLYPTSQPDFTPVGSTRTVDRSLMYTEAARRNTFSAWPHMDYKWALPDAMAQAGFYHGPTAPGDDRALCFTCSVCLVCWEPTDEPWSEHERHSPNCPHVRGEHTQNVPLAATLAAGPAQTHGSKSNHICCISSSSSKHYIATATENGSICLWDVTRQLKVCTRFTVKLKSEAKLRKARKTDIKEAWAEEDDQTSAKQKESVGLGESNPEQKDIIEKDEGYGTISDLPGTWTSTQASNGESVQVTALHVIDGENELEGENLSVVNGAKGSESVKGGQKNNNFCYIFVGIRALLPDKSDGLINDAISLFDSKEKTSHKSILAVYSTSQKKFVEKWSKYPQTKSKSAPSESVGLAKTGGVSSLSELLMPQVMSLNEQELKYVEVPVSLPPVEALDPVDDHTSQDSAMKEGFQSLTQTKFNMSIRLPSHIDDDENLFVSSVFSSTDQNCIVVILSPVDCLRVVNKNDDITKCNIRVQIDKDVSKANGLSKSQNSSDKDLAMGFDDADFNGDVCDKLSASNKFGLAINEDVSYSGKDEVDFGKPTGAKNPNPHGGYILVYSICLDDYGTIENLTLRKSFRIEDPNRSLSDIVLLPLETGESNSEKSEDAADAANLYDSSVAKEANGTASSYGLDEVDGNTSFTQNIGQFAALTKEGGVIFMDIATCDTLAYLPPLIKDIEGKDRQENQVDKFAALTYCTGMERISVCTESGELRFLQLLQGAASDQSAKDDVDCDANLSVMILADQDGVFMQSAECLVNQPITAENLKQLTELTKFETLIPRFSATVPPVWTEIQQEQQQRRHPQHLHQKHHGDATQHTRTWKLAATGAKEHLFELVLPKPSVIGHIDVKLNFQHFCDRVPGIQITLLKQTSQHGIGKDPTPVDTPIDFNMDMLFSDTKESSKDQSNATSSINMHLGDMDKNVEEKMKSVFLESHKSDIICGPLSLDSAIDVPGCSGLVTLTSHALLQSKYRSFLLHICTSEPSKTNASGCTRSNRKDPPFILTMFQNPPPVTPSEHISAFAFTKDLDRIQGCDWIQEISVTIRKTMRTSIPNDRVQRLAMLESSSFHRKIVGILIGSESTVVCGSKEFTCSLALDILCWVAGVQVSEPNRTTSSIVDAIQRQMNDIIRVCFLESGRSIAHRCSQLFMLCIGCTKNQGDKAMAVFHDNILQGLLHWVPSILNAASAGSLHWFFLLLNLVKSGDLESTSETCASFLNIVAKQLQEKMLPQHALLRAKYGLHGTPLDPIMFDGPAIFLPAKTSTTSSASTIQQSMNTFAPPLPTTSPNFQQSMTSDGKTLGGENGKGNGNGNGELVPAPGGVMMKGILEVEPLHFFCCATSDGTQVKKTGVEGAPVASLHAGGMNVNESGGSGPAAAAALSALSNAMTSAEQQLQVLQHRTQMLVKLQQRKQKLAQKLQYASSLGHPNVESLYTSLPKTGSSSYSWAQLPLEATTGPSWYLSPGKSFAQAITHGPTGKNGSNGGTAKSPPNGGQSTKSASTVCVQSLIQPPQPHLLVIDRMHSGARRYVTLDFGRPILLTDVFIPSCTELASLSIDLWSQGEEIDGQRLVVSMDISKRDLTMNDLLPPPLCRYVKITVIGRYGRNTVRTKIPIGCFYGHSFVFPWEQELHVSGIQSSATSSLDETVSVEQYAQSVAMLQEDIHCRYRLACDRLEHLLDAAHSAYQSPSQATRKEEKNGMSSKMRKAYMECIQLQNQLNLVQRVINRLKQVNQEDADCKLELLDKESSIKEASGDQLRVVAEYLVGCLISITSMNSSPATLLRIMSMDSCKALFKNLIMCGTPRLQTCTGALLLRVCRSQVWWGEFLATSLEELFNSEQTEVFPQERVFVLLALLGHRSIMSGNMGVLEHFLSLLAKLLSPLQSAQGYYTSSTGNLDLPLVGWVLLFLSRTLEQAAPPVIETQTEEDENGNDVGAAKEEKKSKQKAGSRWDFINSDMTTTELPKAQRGSVSQAQRQRLAKQMKMHEEQIKQLESKHKAIQTMLVEEGKDKDPLVLQKVFKEYKQHKSKHSKDLLRIRRLAYQELHQKKDSKGEDENSEQPTEFVQAQIRLPREQCLPVVQGLTQLLLAMDFTCHVDLFLVACKVLARICNSTRPAITLAEVMTQQQLHQLLMLCVGSKFNCGSSSWGGPWASHAIICLLQDVLEGELLHPVIESASQGAYGEERLEVDPDLASDAAPEIEVAGATGGADENGTAANVFDVIGDAVASHFPPLSSTPEESLMVHPMQQPSFILDPLDIGYPLADEAEDFCFGSTKYYGVWEDGYSMKSPKIGGKYMPSKVIAASSSGRILYQSMNGNGNGKGNGSGALQNVSLAMDARLELGLQMQAEWFLKISSLTDVSAVSQAQANCIPSQPGQCSIDLTDSVDSSTVETPLPTMSSMQMLTVCFNQLFGDLRSHRVNVEALLQLWLTLNINATTTLEPKQESKKFNASLVPTIPLSQDSMSHILACLARQPNTPLQTWCLTFQALCCLANSRCQDTEDAAEAIWMANVMVEDPNLLLTLVQFFSGNITQLGDNTIQGQAGPSVVQAVKDFLVRLQMRVATSPEPHTSTFKALLLDLLQIMVVEPRGAFQVGTGPLDAQIFLLECILEQQFTSVDVPNTVNLIDAIILLVHNHLSAAQQVTSHCASTSTLSARSCFTGLFASMLRAVDCKSIEGGVGRDDLMCYLLRLVNTLVEVPIGTVEVPLSDSNVPDNHKSNTPEVENSNLEPMTDSSKINAAQQQQDLPQGASGASFTAISDEEKQRTGESSEQPLNTSAISDEEKSSASTSSSAPATTECVKYIADIILSQSRSVTLLLSALSYCNSNTMAMIIGCGFSQITTESTGESVSVGDNIFQVLCTLNAKATVVDLILRNILSYIGAGGERGLPAVAAPLSEPLLWFIHRALSSDKALQAFHNMGGIQLICRNLVCSNQTVIDTTPSAISSIMQRLGVTSKTNGGAVSTSASIPKSRGFSSETETIDGLYNFAPHGTISSTSPTAQPAEVLIQPQAPHRRARSPAWSYHFYPDESWCDLTITLPGAVLIKEIHIQPHLASLATCPSAVAVELSRDGYTSVPISSPISTGGLTYVKLQLQKPQITRSVCLKLHRPRDSSTIGLSQIMLLGLSAFSNMSAIQNPFLPTEDTASKSSIGWLRLLYHSLTHSPSLEPMMSSAASTSTPHLLTTCTALLLSRHSLHASSVEVVLLKIGLHSTELGLSLFDILLRNLYLSDDDGQTPSLLGRGHGGSSDSTVEIIYQLGMTQDQGTKERVQALLEWLGDTARVALHKHSTYQRAPHTLSPLEVGLLVPSPAHIHCVATIIWSSFELPVPYDLRSLLTQELFSSIYEWSMVLPCNDALKKAADFVLCSMCYVQPSFFTSMMEWMGVVHDTSLDMVSHLTDDSKGAEKGEASGSHDQQLPTHQPITIEDLGLVILNEDHLTTLAIACRSMSASQQLITSGFLAILTQALVEFCEHEFLRSQSDSPQSQSPQSLRSPLGSRQKHRTDSVSSDYVTLTADLVAPVLNFFGEVSHEPAMKEWLGGAEGNVFWKALLNLLCNNSTNKYQTQTMASGRKKSTVLTSQQRSAIENAAISFFSKAIACHSENQRQLAEVICDVICYKNGPNGSNLITGFTRRLILQLMLQDEKILLHLKWSCHLYKPRGSAPTGLQHPSFGTGHKFRTIEVELIDSIGKILSQVSDTASLTAKYLEKEIEKQKPLTDKLSLPSLLEDITKSKLKKVAGKVNADAGSKGSSKTPGADSKSESNGKESGSAFPRPPTRRGRLGLSRDSMSIPTLSLHHSMFPNQALPHKLTLGQLMVLLKQRGLDAGLSHLHFIMKLTTRTISSTQGAATKITSIDDSSSDKSPDDASDVIPEAVLLDTPAIPSFLHVFASMGGLALIAEHLPMLYPETPRPEVATTSSIIEKNADDNIKGEWLPSEIGGMESGIEENWFQYMEEANQGGGSSSNAIPLSSATAHLGHNTAIPAHSLAAFGLFLRLPGYAEVLLKEHKKAQFLLRLILGVTDDGEGGHILSSPQASCLPTLPFSILITLLHGSPLTTDDGVLLRRMTLDIGALHLVLACMSVLSHYGPRVTVPVASSESGNLNGMGNATSSENEKSQNYWAKGTGFGTGSTTSGWDVEQALNKQKVEEEHVTCLLQVLSAFINPSGQAESKEGASESMTEDQLTAVFPSVFVKLLSHSCLLPAISSYLRNDSVLDMARHIPLYCAVLELLRAFSCPNMVELLLPLPDHDDEIPTTTTCITSLLESLKSCVDTYTSKLQLNKDSKTPRKNIRDLISAGDDPETEGLTLLVPDIQNTVEIVRKATMKYRISDNIDSASASTSVSSSLASSPEERYCAIMKTLQFDTYQMVTEDENGKTRFNIPHHYSSSINLSGNVKNPKRARRLAQEAVTISTSLPLSASSSVFVRCDEERLDLMKVLITGPSETPYANGCFEFDVYFPSDYPTSPMQINLETTGQHSIRFNPNLYNDGKVCLSILNTWHGRPEEKWNPNTSSFLQVLVSIQSLILVSEPYFNEPGYERSRGTPAGTQSSHDYDANIIQATVRWAMLEMVRNPPLVFKNVIQNHFYLKKAEIMAQCEEWVSLLTRYCGNKRVGKTMAHHLTALKRHTTQLREELKKLKPPKNLQNNEKDEKTEEVPTQTDKQELGAKNMEAKVEEEQEEAKPLTFPNEQSVYDTTAGAPPFSFPSSLIDDDFVLDMVENPYGFDEVDF